MNNKALMLSVTEIRSIINGDTQDTVIAVPVASRIEDADGTILVIQEKDLSAGILEDTAAVLRQTSQYEYKYKVISGHLYYIRNGLKVLGSRYDAMIKESNAMLQRMEQIEQNEIKPTSFLERFKNYFKGKV